MTWFEAHRSNLPMSIQNVLLVLVCTECLQISTDLRHRSTYINLLKLNVVAVVVYSDGLGKKLSIIIHCSRLKGV